jgi:hypothetical protein
LSAAQGVDARFGNTESADHFYKTTKARRRKRARFIAPDFTKGTPKPAVRRYLALRIAASVLLASHCGTA